LMRETNNRIHEDEAVIMISREGWGMIFFKKRNNMRLKSSIFCMSILFYTVFLLPLLHHCYHSHGACRHQNRHVHILSQSRTVYQSAGTLSFAQKHKCPICVFTNSCQALKQSFASLFEFSACRADKNPQKIIDPPSSREHGLNFSRAPPA